MYSRVFLKLHVAIVQSCAVGMHFDTVLAMSISGGTA